MKSVIKHPFLSLLNTEFVKKVRKKHKKPAEKLTRRYYYNKQKQVKLVTEETESRAHYLKLFSCKVTLPRFLTNRWAHYFLFIFF